MEQQMGAKYTLRITGSVILELVLHSEESCSLPAICYIRTLESFLRKNLQHLGSRKIEKKHCYYPQQIIRGHWKYKAARVSVRESQSGRGGLSL